MNFKTIITAISLTIAAAPGFAGGATQQDAPMQMSRTEIRADIAVAPDSYLSRGEAYGTVVPVSTASRASVLADLQSARAAGLVVAGSEGHGMFRPSDFMRTNSGPRVLAGTPGGNARFYGGG